MRSNSLYRAFVLLLGTLTVTATASAGPASVAQPAVWMPHDMIVRLENLPKRYPCDDLWYKFHDVLLKIGARPGMSILTYRCGQAAGEIGRSPSLHLRFETPAAVHGAQVRWSDVQATPTTVHLEPGQPPSIDASDCELLRQMKATLLESLSDRVVDYHLACQVPATSQPHFGLSVEALTAAPESQVRVATRAAQPRRLADPISSAGLHHAP
jgi:hypothetical protein